ncbi:hypothetical protein MIND_00563700 [Mycena indigotica]|uniref:Uncharacterized protein n=1 Tax=Mycena indigotica TaxID=2126181 RepID=A0A8H6W2N5_9AGAR|nr:uncharacterized protein MIND_00563700 [Mycena indigotica]KAF7303359.1 hypothetical protein MIND_00563700 [Mycena indigotica]
MTSSLALFPRSTFSLCQSAPSMLRGLAIRSTTCPPTDNAGNRLSFTSSSTGDEPVTQRCTYAGNGGTCIYINGQLAPGPPTCPFVEDSGGGTNPAPPTTVPPQASTEQHTPSLTSDIPLTAPTGQPSSTSVSREADSADHGIVSRTSTQDAASDISLAMPTSRSSSLIRSSEATPPSSMTLNKPTSHGGSTSSARPLSSRRLAPAAVVGIAIGVVLLIALAFLIVFRVIRWKRRRALATAVSPFTEVAPPSDGAVSRKAFRPISLSANPPVDSSGEQTSMEGPDRHRAENDALRERVRELEHELEYAREEPPMYTVAPRD